MSPRIAGLLVLLAVHTRVGAFDDTGLPGTWQFDKTALVGKATIYTTFSSDGQCAQVAKATIVGVTQWVTDRCEWSLDQAVLSLKVTSSLTTPKQIGTVTKVTLKTLTPTTLSYESKGDLEQWTRVDSIPPEYAGKLAAEQAQPIAGGSK